ncbi:hypothetical protein HG535_0B06770 [Zygotorulaspora mrakii]|uniref:Protein LOT5 n=1 Tax=Zygotorulaspora mrakii TaxID=42260 RepID=A0A7H9AZ70_ZYGMR|nr:uncharacterized protein HG535_0B06770 [Zygotorulaspora mrakii]QLG71631.1 hypothetical protein HG535_0B06770 [Zygotorulaspora mrakii]
MALQPDDVKRICRTTDVKPTVENVIPYNRYKRTQPEINGVRMMDVPTSDQLLLLAGGRDLNLSLLQDEQHRTVQDVELFILNIGFMLWFGHLDSGLEIPYESIIYHGSIKADETVGHQLALLITLETDPVLADFFQLAPAAPVAPIAKMNARANAAAAMQTVEITLRPKYSLYDRHYNAEIESLFTFQDFGVNRGDEMVDNCHRELAACLEAVCHDAEDGDVESDDQDVVLDEAIAVDEDQLASVYVPFSETLGVLDNTGLADDLGGSVPAHPVRR